MSNSGLDWINMRVALAAPVGTSAWALAAAMLLLSEGMCTSCRGPEATDAVRRGPVGRVEVRSREGRNVCLLGS